MRSNSSWAPTERFEWIDAVKGFAILGILLNHLVEEFAPGAWFTNPSDNWPAFAERMHSFFPPDENPVFSLVKIAGWLGDSFPGVFLLLSGMGLTLSAMKKHDTGFSPVSFYKKRLLRIFPLYILIHFIIVLLSVGVPQAHVAFTDYRVLLSFLGLRFTDQLFFFINPSWWFIWTLFQLYLIFPFLLLFLNRSGVRLFLFVSFLITFIIRLLAITGIYGGDSLYYWMTGLFAGTRLAEFSSGMVLAFLLVNSERFHTFWENRQQVAFLSVLIYLAGLFLSFTLAGSIVSNLLVTIGLTGITVSIWRAISSTVFSGLRNLILWIGSISFALFLLHQAPLKWTAFFSSGIKHAVLALLVIGFSFPLAAIFNKIISLINNLNFAPRRLYLPFFLILAFILDFFLSRAGNPVLIHVLNGILLVGILTTLIFTLKIPSSDPFLCSGMFSLFLLFLGLLLAPHPYHKYILFISLLFLVISLMVSRLKALKSQYFLASLIIFVILLTGTELLLKRLKPLEGADWGELPVLQIDHKSVYSLKPNQQTRLRYNAYDYVLKTNAQGIPGPQVQLPPPRDETRVLIVGDAFSMPEGIPYEDSWIALAQKILDSLQMRVRLINGAVTGYGPREIKGRIDTLASLFKPALVLYQFFVNDYEEAHLLPLTRQKEIGLIKTPDEYLPRWFMNRQIFLHADNVIRSIKQRTNRYDWYFYYKSFLHLYQKNDNFYFSPEALHVTDSLMISIDSLCRSYQSRLIVMYVPSAVEVRNPNEIDYLPAGISPADTTAFDTDRGRKHLAALTAQRELPFLDLCIPLNRATSPPYFSASWHWNPTGHKIAAVSFVKFLLENLHLATK